MLVAAAADRADRAAVGEDQHLGADALRRGPVRGTMVTSATASPRASAAVRAARTASMGNYTRSCTGHESRSDEHGAERRSPCDRAPRPVIYDLPVHVAHLGRFGAAQERLLEQRAGSSGPASLPVSRSMSTQMMPGGSAKGRFGWPASARHHERRPDGQRRLRAAQAERLVVVEAHPDHGQQLRREADEPRVAQVVGGARLASGVEREAAGARARRRCPRSARCASCW